MPTLRLGITALATAVMLTAGAARAETVEQAMADAYRTNPTLAGARAQLRAVDEQVASALSAKRPTVLASGHVGISNDSMWFFIVKQLPIIHAKYNYGPRQAEVDASQPLYHGGSLDASLRAAEASVAIQQSQTVAAEQTLLNAAGVACADIIRSDAGLKLAKEYEAAVANAREGVMLKLRGQDATATDVELAQSRLELAHALVTRDETLLATAQVSFQAVVGRRPDGIPTAFTPDIGVTSEDEVLDNAMRDSPSLVAASFAEAAAQAGQDVAVGDWLPAVDLTASQSFARQDRPIYENERIEDVGPRVTLKIYTGGAQSASLHQAEDVVGQRHYEMEDTIAAVTAAVHQGWQGVETSRRVVEANARRVDAAVRSLEGVKRQYGRGHRTFLEVLDALREMLIARSNLIDAERADREARLRLLAIMGKLTARSLQLPVTLYDPAVHLRETYRAWLDIAQ
jgi:outer membrane protein/adhesin transport system outer membrane protein